MSEAAPAVRDPRIAAALDRLTDLEELPVGEQVQVFTDIHARLTAVLADSAGMG